MKKIFVFCFFTICALNVVSAHNPLSAMYYLEVEGDFGILNISLSQTGLHEAISKAFKDKELSKLSEVEYKQLVISYVKEKFHLKINGTKINLLDGGVKLGNHQTDLKFLIEKLPKTFNTLVAQIDAFKENEHHQTILSIKLNDKTSKVILSETNNYSTAVNFVDNKMVSSSSQFKNGYLWFIAIIPIAFFVRKVIPSHK